MRRTDRTGDNTRVLSGFLLLLAAAPEVAVITMGEGDDLFSHFGHAAICVRPAPGQGGRCYNYGTADFSTPLPLTVDFIRGRARFWVSVADEGRMLAFYRREDRSLYQQVLPLDPAQAARVAAALEASTAEGVRYYRYHHFLDNCTTRIRDLLDREMGGRLSAGPDLPAGPSFRRYAAQGFAGDPWLLLAALLVLGRDADRPTTAWEGMFLPAVFRREVERRLGAPPTVLYQRTGAAPRGALWLGELVLFVAGAAAALSITRLRGRRLGLLPAALALGAPALLLWTLALASAFAELRNNEVLLLLWPTDLLLPLAPARWLGGYARVRLGAAGLLLLGAGLGLLLQPLSAPLWLVLAPMLALTWPMGQGRSAPR